MAQMHPLELPTWIREDPALRAERRVFDSLSQLDDDHHIFYRVAWHAGQRPATSRWRRRFYCRPSTTRLSEP